MASTKTRSVSLEHGMKGQQRSSEHSMLLPTLMSLHLLFLGQPSPRHDLTPVSHRRPHKPLYTFLLSFGR